MSSASETGTIARNKLEQLTNAAVILADAEKLAESKQQFFSMLQFCCLHVKFRKVHSNGRLMLSAKSSDVDVSFDGSC